MQTDKLSTIFSALADPTRRAILARLETGDLTVAELCAPFNMTQPAVSNHLRVLESAGLISRSRKAQSRPCHLEAANLQQASAWIEHYSRFWATSFARLDAYLTQLQTPPENHE